LEESPASKILRIVDPPAATAAIKLSRTVALVPF
jgi:hypothetical protein